MRTYSYGCKAPIDNAARAWNQLERAHRYYNTLIEIERDRRARWRAATTDEERAIIQAEMGGRQREERARCGTYWGTYLAVEDAAQRASRSTPLAKDPRGRSWDQEGVLAVQLQGGLSAADLLAGTDSRVRLVGEGKRRHLWLRIGSDGRAPIWAVWPIVWHRDIPATAKIKWVRLVARRVATHTKWNAQFVIDAEPETWSLPSPTLGAVAVDIGWRLIDGGMRVATWANDTGDAGELRLSPEWISRAQKVEDLRSIRDGNFNRARETLALERREDDTRWPKWLADATRSIGQWRSPERLASLAVRWRAQRFNGDERIFDALESWRKQDKHLYEWERAQHGNVLRARREQYRLFARFLAQHRRVVFERMDLRDFAEHPLDDDEPEPHALANARGRRHLACLHELRDIAEDAIRRAGGEWIEVKSAGTTQTCAACGREETFDAAREIRHACSHCAAEWDQDENAARNILARAATCSPSAPDRSIGEKTGKSTSAERRAKGLATRRARRSQAATQNAETSR